MKKSILSVLSLSIFLMTSCGESQTTETTDQPETEQTETSSEESFDSNLSADDAIAHIKKLVQAAANNEVPSDATGEYYATLFGLTNEEGDNFKYEEVSAEANLSISSSNYRSQICTIDLNISGADDVDAKTADLITSLTDLLGEPIIKKEGESDDWDRDYKWKLGEKGAFRGDVKFSNSGENGSYTIEVGVY